MVGFQWIFRGGIYGVEIQNDIFLFELLEQSVGMLRAVSKIPDLDLSIITISLYDISMRSHQS